MIKLKLLLSIIFLLSMSSYAQSNEFVYAEKGRLYHPDGKELALWGVNLQPMLSWEYNAKMKNASVPKNAKVWKKMTDDSLDELELLGVNYIRVHLTPGDFTDANGNLVPTIYLDLLDYMTAEAPKHGIYICYAFFNYMGSSEVSDSFMEESYKIVMTKAKSKKERRAYHTALRMFDKDYLAASKKYIHELLNRVNPYSNIAYKSDANIVLWELMNEPVFLDDQEINSYKDEYTKYKNWLGTSGLEARSKQNYGTFRKKRVLEYINGIYDAVRNAGAVQPIVWSLNWHMFMDGHEDIFEAAAESKVEVVAFCNYPGQGVATKKGGGDYKGFKDDLTTYDFSDWFQQGYNELNWYGWTKSDMFKNKAKVLYEFESFYNQSSYIYPAMADFQRSLGAQAAAMWHYSMSGYAQYNNGSHILNLKTTPAKAAAFAVASQVFQNTPILQPYHVASPVEFLSKKYSYSFQQNKSLYSDETYYCYSNDVSEESPLKPSENVKYVFGYGSSPLVSYNGTGNYQLNISENEIELHIQSDVRYRYDLSIKTQKAGDMVTELLYNKKNVMKINMDEWNRNASVYKIINGKETYEGIVQDLNLKLVPGNYIIRKNEK